MPSIFNNQYKSAQTWDMQGAVIVFSHSTSSTGSATSQNRADDIQKALIVQSLSVSFGRSVNKIYPINIAQAIQLVGIPEGTATMGVIWGPSNALKEFVENYKDDCVKANNGKSITVYPFGKQCGGSGGNDMKGSLNIVSPVISSVGITVQAAQGNAMPVNAAMGLTFIDLEINA